MPTYCYVCDDCGAEMLLRRTMGDAPEWVNCIHCAGIMGRRFSTPYLTTRPDRLRDSNKWWWLKEGEHYNMESKKEMDKKDAKHRAEQEKKWAEQKKISDSA